MKYRLLKASLLSVTVVFSMLASAVEQSLDKVSVIVDQGVILESEISELVNAVKQGAVAEGQALPSDRALRTQAIERLILKSLQMQMAERMGIQISDPQLEQTIGNIAQRDNISIDELRKRVQLDGLSYEVYREKVREELITGEVTRANVRRRVYITPQEIETLVNLISQQGDEQAEYRLGHILIAVPSGATEEEITKSRDTAEKVLELLNSGSDFTKIAIASSSGPKALEGGDMGWMNVNSMPTLFAEAVDGKKKDDLIGPLRSGAGFHVLKILDSRGIETVEVEEVNARHILVKPSIILSDQKAEKMLQEFRTKLIEGEEDFAKLAKQHSEDPGSALKGGVLGWNDPSIYVPEFKDALSTLKKDEYSQPIRTVHGWHLIQLIERRIDDATEKRKEDRAYQLLFNRKFNEETDTWLREMREGAYIELLDKKDL
ncbi:peptidylprolyl isomerase SurA [Brumicola nitratireducens]|uniref:Chaperone SurA n=1 Tax=Glaciecola nitratireducens (strain JCM 12485 / KCTC 12276 / FR1064) TaxID=1085623 RepID=G4QFQ8_GLANF|nr:peptidylprolyl isomerase SurA [Glaciecola nitratireducens]AEP28843.1 survival protein surA [Glaciecola nitratireducens FR1064]